MPLAAELKLVDGDVVPDAGHHVLQEAPLRHVEQGVVVTTV